MRVLIVDDEVLIRNWLDSACAEYGILPEDRVLAANGKDALAKMSGRDFDLIFTDITMPGMSASLPILKWTGRNSAPTKPATWAMWER